MDSRITDPEEVRLQEELRRLKRGRGVMDTDIKERVGPILRRVCGIPADAGAALTRHLLVDRLRDLVDGLSAEDLRAATSAAFALEEKWCEPTLKARLEKVQPLIDRDSRAIRRRVDLGIELIAQNAVQQVEAGRVDPEGPWHIAELRVAVVLDLATPEVFETRRIVADRDGLDEVKLGLTLTSQAGCTGTGSLRDLELVVLYGGVLTERVLKSPQRVGFGLRLPRPLGRNEPHEYALRVQLSPDFPMEPYYVCTPSYPCDVFRLHVRFGRNQAPGSIWRLQNAWSTDVGESWENRECVTADPCGEVHAEFFDLKPRASYGFAWSQDVIPDVAVDA